MQPARQYRNVALVGFMGVGKSTVGQILASLLGFEFLDTDRVIEGRTGRRVAEIFATRGEPAFRAMEAELTRELEGRSGLVIATGGGLVVNRENLESLRRHALVVCLWASAPVIHSRVRNQSHRPLLQSPDPLGRIVEMLESRKPSYQLADVLVGVDFRGPGDTARHIAQSFRRLTRASAETSTAIPAGTKPESAPHGAPG